MMDGYMSGGVAGILYAEDFGDPPPLPEPEPEPVSARALTQHDIDTACIRAVQAAELAWADSAAERRTLALEALSAGMREASAAAGVQAEAVADGVARSVLGMVAAVLPNLCRAHGDAEVRALLLRMIPVVGRGATVVVRVHAGLLPQLETDLAGLDEGLAENVQLRAANLPEGDVRLAWEDGGMVRDTAAIQAAVQDCLSQLGLFDFPIPETRSLVHASAH